jgi:hypothetical protein
MSTLTTNIKPTATTKPAVKAICQYVILSFAEGLDYATARINFADEDGRINVAHDVQFTAEELANWGQDDRIVLSLALAKLGL